MTSQAVLLALMLSPLGQAELTPVRLPEFVSRAADSPATRRALIICGHPGDQPHRATYARAVQMLYEALTERCGFPPAEVRVLFGDKPRPDDPSAILEGRGVSTREAVEKEVEELREVLEPGDALWVIVLGHGHFDGRHSFVNLPGPDVRDEEFGTLFETLECREQVFFITTAASGFFVKHLSQEGRIVISATEPDQEVNETLFQLELPDVLQNTPPKDLHDADKDGVISVLDLYLAVARRVMLRYQADKNIPTEHAQLDDNGDGRCTEVQMDYLPSELGGRAGGAVRPKIRPRADGALAAKVRVYADLIRDADSHEQEPLSRPGRGRF